MRKLAAEYTKKGTAKLWLAHLAQVGIQNPYDVEVWIVTLIFIFVLKLQQK